MTIALTRRRLLTAALATGAAVPLAGVAPAQAAPAGPPRLTLPPPTGPHRVGTVALHLTGGSRDLMAAVWYPAGRDARHHPAAPWMPATPLRALLEGNEFDPDAAAAPHTAGRLGAPVLRARRRLPVILYSHGNDSHRGESTVVVQELASHGYAVVTMDHPYDGYTEFPDGRLGVPLDEPPVTPWDHAHDARFVLDRVEDLVAGRPDADGRRLPAGLGAALDLSRVGMLGWSKGATATALAMNEDRRIRAGIGLDGPMESVPPVSPLHRPFLLMTSAHTRATEPAVEKFWSRLRGWRLNVQAEGAAHPSYCDHQWLIPQLAAIIGMSAEDLAGWVGTLDPVRAVRIQQAYPLAFFDRHLRGRRAPLLDGPSPAFPEVRYLD